MHKINNNPCSKLQLGNIMKKSKVIFTSMVSKVTTKEYCYYHRYKCQSDEVLNKFFTHFVTKSWHAYDSIPVQNGRKLPQLPWWGLKEWQQQVINLWDYKWQINISSILTMTVCLVKFSKFSAISSIYATSCQHINS